MNGHNLAMQITKAVVISQVRNSRIQILALNKRSQMIFRGQRKCQKERTVLHNNYWEDTLEYIVPTFCKLGSIIF